MPESPCWPRDTLKDYLNGSADDQRLKVFMALREQLDELKPHASQANSELEGEPSVIQRVLESVKQFPGSAGASAGPLEKSAQIGASEAGASD